ncbi:unnamed protein product [Heligmosomoides polygyrus]|uniref:Rhodanese domain-containing protein n=1 Tax=Heligmosomoides polygyrus TaxID=6339 RepID=A0A3P7WNK3_HELPZ|nr:unnamed protein product [Heligmosomoides polygyrus]
MSSAKVLVVGAGGLGCPVASYLAGAGIHTIGIVDYDEVAIDNLHRQVAHREKSVGKPKFLLGNFCGFETLECALDIIGPYEIVVDCSDNPATRYLLNDACVLLGKPLVSGSALRWEGQLTVYNYKDENGERSPCYRCLFPIPTNPSLVTNCSEGGVLGPVVGVIGSMQALEVLKIAAGLKRKSNYASKLYLFDGSCGRSRTIALRPRNKECDVCGESPTIKELIDYVAFCGSGACDKVQNLSILSSTDRISASDYSEIRSCGTSPVLLDTRPPHEFAIASLEEAKISNRRGYNSAFLSVFVICHRGNDSQLAVEALKKKLDFLRIRDIRGGYEAWATEVDQGFPRY